MLRRVLPCAFLICTLTASNASAQVIKNMVRRAGVGGSFGGIFTIDEDVNVGLVRVRRK